MSIIIYFDVHIEKKKNWKNFLEMNSQIAVIMKKKKKRKHLKIEKPYIKYEQRIRRKYIYWQHNHVSCFSTAMQTLFYLKSLGSDDQICSIIFFFLFSPHMKTN